MKVTPAHDPTDFEIGRRHELPALNVLTATAAVSDAAPEAFRGLDRYAARVVVLERLRDLGLVVHVERPYVHSVGHCYRCDTEIEPWLAGQQWFVAVDRIKAPAKAAALDGRLTFWPERWGHAFVQWLDGLRDWNISRQLWWGHRIPVWYCPNGHQFAAIEDPKACAECGAEEVEQDPDVLDTWFSSQLWPFSTLGWPEQTEDLAFFYPTGALITGYEILYLWVARMVMSGLYLARRRALPRRGDPWAGPRRPGPEDVEVPRQRDRPARRDRLARRRRAAVRTVVPGDRRAEHPVRRGAHRRRAALREQDLERRAAGALGPGRRRGPRGAAGFVVVDAGGPVAPVAAPGVPRGGRPNPRRLPVRRRDPGAPSVRLVRALRLGPGGGEDPPVPGDRRRANGRRRPPGVGARAEPSDAASVPAVRHRGDLAAVRGGGVGDDRAVARGTPGPSRPGGGGAVRLR